MVQQKNRFSTYRLLCVITGCSGGDWPPLLALAEGLQRRGHDLVVICDTATLSYVQASGLKALCLPHDLELANVFNPALSRLLSGSKRSLQQEQNPLEVWAISCKDTIKTSLNAWRPALLISSLMGLGLGKILSRELNIPWCFLNPSFVFSHFPGYPRREDFSEQGVWMYRHWLLPPAESANLVFHATDQVFDNCPGSLPCHHSYVGPIFWEMIGNDLQLLKKTGSPWILVTLSTSPQPGDMTLVRTALRALRPMGFRILVSLSPDHDREDLGPIPANVHVLDYTPHSRVLPHCRLVISHAGHGIVTKAMAYGIPMVLVPWGRDQPGVAARAEKIGAAVVVSRSACSVSTLTKAIAKIINDPEYLERSRLIAQRLQNMNGVGRAVDLVEEFLGNR